MNAQKTRPPVRPYPISACVDSDMLVVILSDGAVYSSYVNRPGNAYVPGYLSWTPEQPVPTTRAHHAATEKGIPAAFPQDRAEGAQVAMDLGIALRAAIRLLPLEESDRRALAQGFNRHAAAVGMPLIPVDLEAELEAEA